MADEPVPDTTNPVPGEAAARWVRSSAVLERLLPHGILLLALDGDEPILVTGPGPDLWQVLDQPRSLDEIAALLGERYETDPEIVARDLAPVLDHLLASRLVSTVP